MLLDRPTKTFIAVFTLVAAIMLAVNYAVKELPIEEWGLAGLIFVFSAAMWIWIWREQAEAESMALTVRDQAATLPQVQEWVVETDVPTSQPEVAKAEPVKAEDTEGGLTSEPDDLTRVEGVGPKYRDALVAAGISTFADLAQASLDAIESAATAAGMRKAASMSTWAEQAKLAAAEDWAGLEKLQENLTGGRRD